MPKKPAATKKASAAPVPKVRAATVEAAVLYVRAGRTEGWRGLYVFDLKAKKYLPDILEANALEGWYVQAVRDAAGQLQRRGESMATRRVSRAIRIDRRG